MNALIIDDEPIILAAMKRTVLSLPETESAVGFEYPEDALAWAQNNSFDFVFADIMMDGMKGTDLAQKLREINPDCRIVYCTGYSEYAVEAINRGIADGYLIKPVGADDVRATVERLNARRKNILLTAKRRAGILFLYDKNGTLLIFKRKKTERLFDILLEQKGKSLSTDELCEMMWEHTAEFIYKNRQYLYSLTAELKSVLTEHGAADVFIKNGDGYCLDVSRVKLEE